MAHGTNDEKTFMTPQRFLHEQGQRNESPRGRLLVASCRSASCLAAEVVRHYRELSESAGGDGRVLHLDNIDDQFSDTETYVRLDRDVSGHDVFLFQALYDPTLDRRVDENYMAFLLAVRAFREWGANQVTAVLPYLAYARQDKPTTFQREPTAARLMADLSRRAGIDRMVTWHPHSPQVNAFYDGTPVHMLDFMSLFVDQFRHLQARAEVIAVAPDAGAAKFVSYFGQALSIRSAIAVKHRPRPEEAHVSDIIGDFAGKHIAIVLDDMIGTGGTVYALIKELVAKKGIEEVYLGVSHNLCMPQAQERLLELHRELRLQRVIVTDSIPQTGAFQALPFVSVVSIAEPLSRCINRIHFNRPVSELLTPPDPA